MDQSRGIADTGRDENRKYRFGAIARRGAFFAQIMEPDVLQVLCRKKKTSQFAFEKVSMFILKIPSLVVLIQMSSVLGMSRISSISKNGELNYASPGTVSQKGTTFLVAKSHTMFILKIMTLVI